METFRLMLTVAWCAVLAGLNAFVLFAVWIPGLRAGAQLEPVHFLPLGGLVLTLCLAIAAMVRPGLLWALVGVLFIWLVLHAVAMLTGGSWRPRQLVGSLIMIAPTYLLARWHTVVVRRHKRLQNPAEEF